MILFRNIDRFINNLILAIYLLINLHFIINIIINSFNTNIDTNIINITDLKLYNIKWGISPIIPVELIKNINVNNSLFPSKLFQELYIIKN